MSNIINRLSALRRKLGLEDFLMILGMRKPSGGTE